MKMKKTTLLIAALTMTAICAVAKDKEATARVTPIAQDADAANGGLIYSLPTTALRITVEAELTIEKEGPFYRYSNKYLNLSDVVKEDRETWRLVGASVDTYGVADAEHTYKITTQGADVPALVLNAEGVIEGINAPARCGAINAAEPKLEKPVVNFDNVHHERTVLARTSSAAMAEETANAIYRLREKRLSLLGGEDATILHDKGSYEQVLAQIDSLEAEYTSLFAGKKMTIRVSRTYTYVPQRGGESSGVLLRFSATNGFLDAMDLTGKPVYVDVAFADQSKLNEYADGSKQRKEAPVTGLRYIRPSLMNVKVIDRTIVLWQGDVRCSQGGQILSLPASVLLNPNAVVVFDTATGALQSISYSK